MPTLLEQPENWPTDGDTVLKTTRAHVAHIPLQVRLDLLQRMEREHPDIWQWSEEVDFTLVAYMLELTPPERLQAIGNGARFVEACRGASKISKSA